MPPTAGTSTDGGTPGNGPQPPKTFASVAAGPLIKPRLSPVPISKRPLAYVDNTSTILFTPIEVD